MAPLPAATRAAAAAGGLCRIAASASSSSPSSAAPADGGRRRRERELPLALLGAERGMVVGGHRGMGMNAVGAPPGTRVGAARERENTLLSFGRAAAHAAVAFVEFDVQLQLAMETPSSSRVQASNGTATSGPLVDADGTENREVVDISEGEEDEVAAPPGSKRKLTSVVWNDFEKVFDDGRWKAQCHHCKRKLSATSRNDGADGKFNSLWSCLEDIEEEMKEESCITTADSD